MDRMDNYQAAIEKRTETKIDNPLLFAHPDFFFASGNSVAKYTYISVIFLRCTYLFTSDLLSLLLINSITGKTFMHAVCVIFNKGHHTPFSNVAYFDLKKNVGKNGPLAIKFYPK